jgi:hypothetical protein
MPDLNSDLDDTLEPIVRVLRAALLATLESHLVQIFISADKETVYWGMTKGGIPIAYEGPPMDEAINWARKHCAQLVTKMDEETKTKLAQVVADAIKEKKGVPGLSSPKIKGLGERIWAGILIMANPGDFRNISAYLRFCGLTNDTANISHSIKKGEAK